MKITIVEKWGLSTLSLRGGCRRQPTKQSHHRAAPRFCIFFFLLLFCAHFALAADTVIKGTTTDNSTAALDVTDSADTTLLYVRNDGNVGIGTASPTSALQVVGLPVYANNAAAVAGGLSAGALYRTGGDPDQVCVAH